MTRREKFCEMNRLLRDIADMSADLGHHNFCSRFHFIVDLHKAWSQSKLVSLVVESQGYGSAEPPGHDNRDTAPRNTNVTAERELRPVSILGFENCQSFFPYNCPCTYGNARRTAMRGAHQFDCHNTCQTLKTAAEHHIQTTV